jgi:HSP20 family molecular chaperone IbpA
MSVTALPQALLPANASITETERGYVVAVEVPGFALEDLRVEIQGHELAIHGDAGRRRLDQFIRLPFDADVEWPAALYEPGRLEVHVPKLGACGLGRREVEIVPKHELA